MAIFRFELRQMRGAILWWGGVLALCIYAMLPVYVGMIVGGGYSESMRIHNDLMESIGASMRHLSEPLGVYGFLTSFAAIAGAMNGLFFGISVFAKEYMHRTADFLMTTPHNRTRIFLAKVLAAAVAATLVGLCYIIGSVVSAAGCIPGFANGMFWRIAVSFWLLQMAFVAIGALVGNLWPHIRTPGGAASGIGFLFYIIAAFSRKVGNTLTALLSPFTYFGSGYIMDTGHYSGTSLIAFSVCLVLCLAAAYGVYSRRDVLMSA